MITDRFIYFHFHKAGGTTQRDYILYLAEQGRIKIEENVGECSARPYAGDPRFKWGHVRNPWAWYVSRYRWFVHDRFVKKLGVTAGQVSRGVDDGIWDAPSRDACLTFREHMLRGFERDSRRGMRELYASGEKGRPEFVGVARPPGYGRWPAEPFFAMVAVYRDMFCAPSGELVVDLVARIEGLGKGPTPYEWAGVDLGGLRRPDQQPRVNVVISESYEAFYDDELREMVSDVDAFVIERHDYTFGDPDPARGYRPRRVP